MRRQRILSNGRTPANMRRAGEARWESMLPPDVMVDLHNGLHKRSWPKTHDGMPTVRPAHLQAVRCNGRLQLRKVGPVEHTPWHSYNHADCDGVSSLTGRMIDGGGRASGSGPYSPLCKKGQTISPRRKKAVSADYSTGRVNPDKLKTVQEGVPSHETGRRLLPRSRSLPLETRHLADQPVGPPKAIVKEMQSLLTAVANSMQRLKLFRRSIPEGDESAAEIMPGSSQHPPASLWASDRRVAANSAAISCG